jgi:EAL domain-containing protein (putative c-di-GMP-specific phosphodiesterase class I)
MTSFAATVDSSFATAPQTAEIPTQESAATQARFPAGWIRIATEDRRIARKLRDISEKAGLLIEASEDGVVIHVEIAGGDSACLVLGSSLLLHEQEAVFLLLDRPPYLRSLRAILGKCQYAWLFDLMTGGVWTTHFQPVIDLETGVPFGHEALLRARMSDGASVSPTAVFEAARSLRLLPVIDELARMTALRSGSGAFPPSERILINLDAGSAPAGHFDVDGMLSILAASGRPPGTVIFELVESESLGNPALVCELSRKLTDAGFKVALDDLTSGFSTLAVLDKLRPDVVKLDQRLIGGAYRDRYRSRVVEAFVGLCRDLNILLIAEGIEDAEDLEFVRQSGIRYVQGFLLARPALPPSFAQ